MSLIQPDGARRPRCIWAKRHVSVIALTREHAYWTYHGRERQPMRRARLDRLYDQEDVAPSHAQPNDVVTVEAGNGVVYTLARATEGDTPGQLFRHVGEGPPELIADELVEPGLPSEVGGVVYWVEYANDTGLMSKRPGPSDACIRFRRPGGPRETLENVKEFSGYVVGTDGIVYAASVVREYVMVGPIGGDIRRFAVEGVIGDPVVGPAGTVYASCSPGHVKPTDRIVTISAEGVRTVLSGRAAWGIGPMASDATHLYWSSRTGIYRWAPSGGDPEQIQEPEAIPQHSLTVGPTAIAWAITQGRFPVESRIYILPKEA